MRWTCLILVAAVVTMAPLSSHAQSPSTACAFDTAAFTFTHSFTLGISAANPDLTPADGPPEAVEAARTIAAYFDPPASLALPFWARVAPAREDRPPPPSSYVGHGLDDFIHLTLGANGRLADRRIDVRTVSYELNDAITAAILKADSAGAFPAPSSFLAQRDNRITLRLVNKEHGGASAFPLMAITLPMVRAESNVKVLRFPDPQYPRNALAARVEEEVELSYVVGVDGAVDNSAPFQLRRVLYRPFAEAVVVALKGGRYVPAQLAGCPVPMLAHQGFGFKLRR